MNIINKLYNIKILNNNIYYKVIFLLWALSHSVSFAQYYTPYLSPLLILWGGMLVLRSLFIDRPNFPKRYYIIVGAFLLSYVVTIIINRNMNFFGNTKTLIWGIIMMIVLFVNDLDKNKDEVLEEISIIAKYVIIGSLIISAICIIMFIFNINFWTNRVDGARIPQGYYAARLWGIYVDPNQSCNVAIISILLSGILLIIRKGLGNIVLYTNIVIQYLLIVLSGSRGGEIGLILVIAGVAYFFIESKVAISNNNVIKKLLSIILSLIISISVIGSFKPTRKILAYIPTVIHTGILYFEDNKEEVGDLTVERADLGTSNGRIQLWTDAFKMSKEISIFGVGDRNIMKVADELMPGSSITKQYVHNGYLHMLLSGGIVAVIIMLILLGSISIPTIKNILMKKNFNEDYLIYGIMSIIIASMLLTTVFLTEIFYQNSFVATIFWILLGYIVYFNHNNDFTY